MPALRSHQGWRQLTRGSDGSAQAAFDDESSIRISHLSCCVFEASTLDRPGGISHCPHQGSLLSDPMPVCGNDGVRLLSVQDPIELNA